MDSERNRGTGQVNAERGKEEHVQFEGKQESQ